ncbi:cleavage and polyadenylation specificity factor subunit 2, partial [Pancytospora epiphaga]
MVHTELVVRPLIDTKTGIFCHMIEFGGSKIVVDCGIDETFDYSLYDGCFQEIQGADCILITTFSLAHMGAVGLFFEKPIYCAVPTTVLGQIVIRDCSDKYNSFYGKSINTRVNSIQIKFSQPFKVNDVEICAFNAGCCAGNSLFRISYGMLSIMVGYDLNQRKVNYSDGLDIELLRGSSVLITNSAYARVPSYTIKGRNQMLYDIIRGCDGKVLIVVQFFHLIELLSIISKEKIIVVSRHGKLFVDRLKSMVEWAGAQANDIFADLNVDFGKIEDLTDHNVVIVVTDVPGVSYLGTVLERFNQPENLLLLINRGAEEIVFEKLPVCSFGYFVRKIKMSDSLAVSTIDNDNEEYDENTHWTMRTNAIFVKKLDRKSLFPHIQRKIHRSDYGETFDITMEKQSEAPIKE